MLYNSVVYYHVISVVTVIIYYNPQKAWKV